MQGLRWAGLNQGQLYIGKGLNRLCLDTCILVWGIQGKAIPEFSHKVKQARHLLSRLEREKAKIIVPAPVVFEFLLDVHPEMHGTTIQTLQQRFRIIPFDTAAAAKNAEIWLKKTNAKQDGISEIRSRWPAVTKAELRHDCQIISIAALHKADVLYSEDPHFVAFAKGIVNVQPAPEAVEQMRLF